ncbi:hypothetical protein [Candidatus Methylomirabilis sp.]|uniref:Uncharacterized protein n=1 Tax=Candidatus Methylomirabilis tolerans TaxID=3123416 RepID=A0AAJ1AG69_9BACT|nr:hypothetical protein [Candidatus Methylomirabilis sp.]
MSAIETLSATEFISLYLFDRVPHIFGDDRRSFLSWKGALAKAIEVDPACITLVGSSAVGISLNPSKGFRPFDSGSDVDVGVISHYHFTVAWRFLRTQGHRRTHVDAKTRVAWDEHVKCYIYWGTIATDRLLGILPFGKKWLAALTTMAQTSPTVGRDINLRIYSDYESLRAYQIWSAQRAREDILTKGEADAPIP